MAHGVWRGSLTVTIAMNSRLMPSDEEWGAFVDTLRGVYAAAGDDVSRIRSIGISDGGVPTARQRHRAATMIGERPLRWVLLSTSRLARGVGNALSWFQPDFKAYAPSEFARAARFLGVPPGERESLLRRIREIDRPLGLTAVAELGLHELDLTS